MKWDEAKRKVGSDGQGVRVMRRRDVLTLVGTAAAAALKPAHARSQEQASSWPSRPIKIITPLAAGGAGDVLARAVGDELFATLRQPVVIENRPGGGGMLAASTVA